MTETKPLHATGDEERGPLRARVSMTLTPRSKRRRATVGHCARVSMTSATCGTTAFPNSWAIARAREHDCRLVQLTSDKQRERAIAFYERLGFVASHEGLKLEL